MVNFNELPADVRVPFVYVEFDSSKAIQGAQVQPFRILVIGQRLAAGTVEELVPTRVQTADQARAYFGAGSMLHGMARTLFLNNRATETHFVALDDAGGAADADGSITFTGPATAAGTIYAYVAGRRLTVGVADEDTATAIGDAVVAAVTADPTLPVTATNDAGEVTFTAKNAGEAGNSIDLRLNYLPGEALPAGVSAVVVAMSGGTGNPDVADVWPVLGDEHFNVIAFPYTDSANLNALDAELADRWGPLRQIEGLALTAAHDTHANLLDLGDGRNGKHVAILGQAGCPTPPYEVAGALAGLVAFHGQADPAQPFQTLELKGVLAPGVSDRFTWSERDQLLRDGIATATVDAGGLVRIERLVTTYQENPQGAPDTAFLDVNTLLTLGFIRWDFRTAFLLKFARHKLGQDSKRYGSGQLIMTPNLARAFTVSRFRMWEESALVEGSAQFARDLVVERSSTDPNRLEISMSPDLANQLRVLGVQIGFLL